MGGQKRILVVSTDLMLLQTRKLMLGAYFDVCAAGRVLEANRLLAERSFDLIVLCYTLPKDDCQKIADVARQHCPFAKILILTYTGHAASHGADDSYFLASEEGPMILVRKSAELLGFEFRSKGRMVRMPQPDMMAAPTSA